MNVKLFLVAHDDEMDENWDLLVEATDADEALKFWGEEFWDGDVDFVPTENIRVFEVRPTGKPGALQWCTDACKKVKEIQ